MRELSSWRCDASLSLRDALPRLEATEDPRLPENISFTGDFRCTLDLNRGGDEGRSKPTSSSAFSSSSSEASESTGSIGLAADLPEMACFEDTGFGFLIYGTF